MPTHLVASSRYLFLLLMKLSDERVTNLRQYWIAIIVTCVMALIMLRAGIKRCRRCCAVDYLPTYARVERDDEAVMQHRAVARVGAVRKVPLTVSSTDERVERSKVSLSAVARSGRR